MNKRIAPLGDLEQHVMEIIWSEGCATVRCVCDNIQKKRDIAYTTVMTTMDRLTKKHLLKRVKVGKAYEYRACQSEDELHASVSQHIIDSLVDSYGDVALAQFVGIVDQIDKKKITQLKKQLKKVQSDCDSVRAAKKSPKTSA